MELARRNMLMKQVSRTLNKMGLLLPNGGLCASSCFTNIIGAMTLQQRNFMEFPKFAPIIAKTIIEAYNQYTKRDARMGANSHLLLQVFQSVKGRVFQIFERPYFPVENPPIKTKSIDGYFTPQSIHEAMKGDSIAIASVKPMRTPSHQPAQRQRNTDDYFSHAIVLLKVDVENKYLVISDPNSPNLILKIPFRYTDGSIRFRLPSTYSIKKQVEIYELNILTREIEPE